MSALARSLAETRDVTQRTRLLPIYVEALLAAGERTKRAIEASDELTNFATDKLPL